MPYASGIVGRRGRSFDHVLVSRRSAASVIDSKTWWWSSFGSDHGHVLMGARLRSKVERVTCLRRTRLVVWHEAVQIFRKQVADWLAAEAGEKGMRSWFGRGDERFWSRPRIAVLEVIKL